MYPKNDKTPEPTGSGASLMKKPGGDLLSPEIQPTIIGAEAFHCPVRNGKEWDHPAVAVRHRLCPSGTRAPSERIPAEEKTLLHTGCSHILYSFLLAFSSLRRSCLSKQHGYGIKPHGQLVPVSFTPHSASTPGLSTSWSRTTLQGGQASGKTHLQASFPLRCFQRLSLPHIATRQCDWRHNRYTRGASTPVLSY